MEIVQKLGRKRTNEILRNMTDGNFNEIVRPFVFVDLSSAVINVYAEASHDDSSLETKLRKYLRSQIKLRAEAMNWDDDVTDRYQNAARKILSELA